MRKGALIAVGLCLLLSSSVSSEWGEPVNLGPNVNWIGKDYYPAVSADGTTLYYTSNDRPGGFGDDDIWISTWDGTEWSLPVNAGPNVNSAGRDLSPSVTSDGTQLYFVSYGRPGGYGWYDVWISTWNGFEWGPPVNAGPNVNSTANEFTARVSFDGSDLYFSSDRLGGWGSDDLYVSKWDSANSEWGPAVNLDSTVNRIGREYCPSVTTDGSTLYFARWVPGHPDIFVSQWVDTMWGVATNLGPPVNTPTWDNGPFISTDGARLYFASSRDTSNPALQDIWVSEWTPGVQEVSTTRDEEYGATLLSIQPSPFTSSSRIRFTLHSRTNVTLEVYDVSGRLVATLVEGVVDAGCHEILWFGEDEGGRYLKSGVYLCQISTADSRTAAKFVLIR